MSADPRAALEDSDARVRARACRDLARDPAGGLYAERILALLPDESRAVRRAAGDALVVLGRQDPAVAALVLDALRGEAKELRWAALEPARRLGPPEPGWLPAIVEALAGGAREARWSAARLLVDLAHRHPETRGVAAGLARGDERPGVRRMAVLCLNQIDPGTPETRAVLEEAARDAHAEVRRAARLALSGADPGLQNTSASSE